VAAFKNRSFSFVLFLSCPTPTQHRVEANGLHHYRYRSNREYHYHQTRIVEKVSVGSRQHEQVIPVPVPDLLRVSIVCICTGSYTKIQNTQRLASIRCDWQTRNALGCIPNDELNESEDGTAG
jgi:hypothetical protein